MKKTSPISLLRDKNPHQQPYGRQKEKSAKPNQKEHIYTRRLKGFEPIRRLVHRHMTKIGHKSTFSYSQLLKHWAEIVGEEIAAMSQPIDITYNKKMGARLKIITLGAFTPIISLKSPIIKSRINQFYGYNAISKITFIQTISHDFKNDTPKPENEKKPQKPATSNIPYEYDSILKNHIDSIKDTDLRKAVDMLARIISHKNEKKPIENDKATR